MNEQLDKYFLGVLSSAEKRELFSHLEAHPDAKAEYIRLQNTIAISSLQQQEGDDKWALIKMNELQRRIDRTKKRKIYIKASKYAAIFAIILANIWLVANKIISMDQESSLYTQVEVPKGQRVHLTLQDGTKVWLSSRSVMRIPNNLNKKERLIELDGEGFFAVAKDKEHPFIVKTKRYNIKVLGTKFNVFAYSESKRFEVKLVEGSVQVSNNHRLKNKIVMEANEIVSSSNGILTKTKALCNNEEFLKNGIFYFSNKKFSEVLEYLSIWYNIKFEIKNSAQTTMSVSGKFRKTDEITQILKALQGVHSFNYKIITTEQIEIY